MGPLCLAGHEGHLESLSPTHLQQSVVPGSSMKIPLCRACEVIHCQAFSGWTTYLRTPNVKSAG